MEFKEKIIHLDASTGYFQTPDPDDVFRVISGTVLVYIAPFLKGAPVNYKFFCEVEVGQLIPAFSFVDRSYQKYNFYLRPKEEADLVCMHDMLTSVLKRKFLTNHGITNYEDEGYEGCLIGFYEREVAKAEIRILRDQNTENEQNQIAGQVIKNAFETDI